MHELSAELTTFIEAQRLFFVATAAPTGRVNVSPKGMDTLRVLSPTRIAWLSVTGSGNETAAHLLLANRITLMFVAFEGPARILRVYGSARCVYPRDDEWASLAPHFPVLPGTRQIYDVAISEAKVSCGESVPFYAYQGERDELNDWATKKGSAGIEAYWKKMNQASIDGFPTAILTESTKEEDDK